MSFLDPLFGRYHTSATKRAELILKLRNNEWSKADATQVDPYFVVRDRVLSQAVADKLITPADIDRIEAFGIHFDKQIVEYKHPDTNKTITVYLKDVEDSAVQEALFELNPRWNEIKAKEIGKGDATGKEPLQRNTNLLKGLPPDFKAVSEDLLPQLISVLPTPELRKAVVKRVNDVEFVIQKTKEKIKEKITQKEQEAKNLRNPALRANPASGHRVFQLEKEIEHLKAKEAELEKVDVFALAVACAAHPIGPHRLVDLDGYANLLEKNLTDYLQSRAQAIADSKKTKLSQIKNFITRKEDEKATLNDDEKAYIHDIVDMLYTNRSQYWAHCANVGRPMKKERMEDLLLREAIAYVDGEDYDAQGYCDSIHFRDFSPALKTEMDAILTDVVAMLPHAIARDTGQYAVATFPDNATDEQKRQIKIDEMEALKNDVIAQRGRVDFTLIRAPTALSRTVSVVTHPVGMWATIGTGAFLLGGCIPTIWNNPGAALGVASNGLMLMGIYGARNLIPSSSTVRRAVPIALSIAGIGGTLMFTGQIDSSLLQNLYEFITVNPGASLAMLYAATAIPRAAHRYVYRVKSGSRTHEVTTPDRPNKLSKRRLALVALTGLMSIAGGALLYVTSQSSDEQQQDQSAYTAQMIQGLAATAAVCEVIYNNPLRSQIGAGAAQIVVNTFARFVPQGVLSGARRLQEGVGTINAGKSLVNLYQKATTSTPALWLWSTGSSLYQFGKAQIGLN